MTVKEYTTHSPEETEALACEIGRRALASGRRQLFVAFYGEMGAGKTAFTRGFVAGVAPAAAVRSPTYTVVNEYRGTPLPVFHFDLYRVADEDELYALGFDDYLAREGFALCEWSERGGDMLPPDRMTVTLLRTPDHENERELLFENCPMLAREEETR